MMNLIDDTYVSLSELDFKVRATNDAADLYCLLTSYLLNVNFELYTLYLSKLNQVS